MATVPTTFVFSAGSVLTAAQLNTYLSAATQFFLSPPVFEGRQTVTQNFTSGSPTAITFDVEDIDTDNGHSTSSNTSRYTAQTAGRFQVSGGTCYATNVTGRRGIAIYINGATTNAGESEAMAVTNGQPTVPVSRTKTVFLNIADYVELFGYQDSGSTLASNLSIASWQPSFSVRWVGTT